MRQENNEDRMKVYLIGAGPGDPGLLTIKGKDILEKADVVVYDYLANDTLLGYARPDAERIYQFSGYRWCNNTDNRKKNSHHQIKS